MEKLKLKTAAITPASHDPSEIILICWLLTVVLPNNFVETDAFFQDS